MSRRIDQNKTPDPLPGEVIESFLKVGIPYRLAILDFAEAAIPAQTTQDSAFVEAGNRRRPIASAIPRARSYTEGWLNAYPES